MRFRAFIAALGSIAVTVIACGPRTAGDAETAPARARISAMLTLAADAWNAGDLDAFMSDYLQEQRATFITPGGVLRGPDAIRSVYAARFAPGAVRDRLSFEDLEVDVLAPDVVHVIAWYVLTRGDSVTARGPTSLIMERHGDRWLIVHDHSS